MRASLVELRRMVEQESGQPAIACWYHPSGWRWLAIKEEGEGFYFGLVISPICPQGEWGSFGEEELIEVGAIRL